MLGDLRAAVPRDTPAWSSLEATSIGHRPAKFAPPGRHWRRARRALRRPASGSRCSTTWWSYVKEVTHECGWWTRCPSSLQGLTGCMSISRLSTSWVRSELRRRATTSSMCAGSASTRRLWRHCIALPLSPRLRAPSRGGPPRQRRTPRPSAAGALHRWQPERLLNVHDASATAHAPAHFCDPPAHHYLNMERTMLETDETAQTHSHVITPEVL